MTGRIMKTEVRRTAVPGIALLLLVIGAAFTLLSIEFFAGRWTQLALYGRGSLLLLIPLALAGGAWLGRRDRRSRVGELFATTVRPRWQRTLPLAVGYAAIMVVVYLLATAVGAIWVAPTAAYFSSTVFGITTVGALGMVAASWLGMAAGRAVPRIVTAPVLAVVGFAVVALLPDYISMAGYDANWVKTQPDPSALLLTPAFPGGFDDLQTLPTSVSALQAVWLAALAGTALLLIGTARRSLLALAVLPAVLGAAVAVPLLPTGGYFGAAVVDPAAAELVCDDDGPQVCVRKVHAQLLPDIVGPAREALTLMAAKLPDPPVRAQESARPVDWATPGRPPARRPPDTLVFDPVGVTADGKADLSDGYFEANLLHAAWAQECHAVSGPGQAVRSVPYQAEAVATAWLTGEPPKREDWFRVEDIQQIEAGYQGLTALPADQQRQLVGRARAAALDCDYDQFEALLLAGDQ
ncbi:MULTISPECIES: hypothetical protein [unclassified Solwaraspora]|uniref:hypothetical protein n=1 Tax=unclassified Solwaraspora TaxID=2627926 RepID=UPI00259BE623|nr:hypothetical protein [Solwaraspora sp. WMMA2056]WJK39979.1 hypothetical protein O7608_26660 [Solwaraspora sp. WMMA2056]